MGSRNGFSDCLTEVRSNAPEPATCSMSSGLNTNRFVCHAKSVVMDCALAGVVCQIFPLASSKNRQNGGVGFRQIRDHQLEAESGRGRQVGGRGEMIRQIAVVAETPEQRVIAHCLKVWPEADPGSRVVGGGNPETGPSANWNRLAEESPQPVSENWCRTENHPTQPHGPSGAEGRSRRQSRPTDVESGWNGRRTNFS